MRFLSVCSGIEAASAAWNPLGWRAAAVSEIDPFPCHVLWQRHEASRPMHMPDPAAAGLSFQERRRRTNAIKAVADLPEYRPGGVMLPNFGDLEAFKEWPDATVDLLVGGTPCQSFSVAGLRKGLDDPRGNLALVYLAVAARYRPRWVVWENVPGVLSSADGRDFGAFLGALGELGYGWAYRVLDAQYVRTRRFSGAVPQRRRRVFVVGYLGDWRPPAAVFLDRESLSGNSAPRREAGQGVAGALSASSGERGDGKHGFGWGQQDWENGYAVPIPDVIPEVSNALAARDWRGGRAADGVGIVPAAVSPTLRAGGNRTGGDRPPGTDVDTADSLMPVAFAENSRAELRLCGGDGSVASQLTTGGGKPGQGQPVVAFDCKGAEVQFDVTGSAPPLRSMGHDQSKPNSAGHAAVVTRWAVRRLTPVECERLQGFPDGYTDVPYGRRNRTPDGPRYKALGNSMAVNAMEWIGERIAFVNDLGS